MKTDTSPVCPKCGEATIADGALCHECDREPQRYVFDSRLQFGEHIRVPGAYEMPLGEYRVVMTKKEPMVVTGPVYVSWDKPRTPPPGAPAGYEAQFLKANASPRNRDEWARTRNRSSCRSGF